MLASGRVSGVLQLSDLDLAHLEHRLHRPAGTLGIGIIEQLIEPARHDLPGQPEAVLEPTTRAVGFLAPLGLFVGLTLMEAWQLWRLRGDAEAMDPLVMMGLFASLGGLLVGGLLANLLDRRLPVVED